VIVRKCLLLIVFFALAGLNSLSSAEVSRDQYVRLVLNDQTGDFSLYYLFDPEKMQYEPLFNDKDPSASFSAVSVNGKIHRLGESRAFVTRIEDYNGNPVVIHESSFLVISKVFYPVRTISSATANGIKIAITIRNKTNETMQLGFRVLLDTHLGEGRGNIPFSTDNLSISKETLIDSTSGENFWISRGQRLSLMGNITSPDNGNFKKPDFIHIANWKKLSDVPWRAPYYEGRTFNYTHYSVGDSAVCYYYEPEKMGPYEAFEYVIFLTTEDVAWYSEPGVISTRAQTPGPAPEQPLPEAIPAAVLPLAQAEETPIPSVTGAISTDIQSIIDDAIDEAVVYGDDPNLMILKRLQETLDEFITGKTELNEQDLLDIERSIDRYGNR